jgi:hypothetical protein
MAEQVATAPTDEPKPWEAFQAPAPTSATPTTEEKPWEAFQSPTPPSIPEPAVSTPTEAPASEGWLSRILNSPAGVVHTVASLGFKGVGAVLNEAGNLAEQSIGSGRISDVLHAAGNQTEDTAERLHDLGASHGNTDPLAITLDKLYPGSRIASVYNHLSTSVGTGLEQFAAPENLPFLMAGGYGARSIAALFTAAGLSQLPAAKKAFDSAPTLEGKIDVAVPAILGVVAPALGLRGHAAPEVRAHAETELHNNLSEVPNDMLHSALNDPKLSPEIKAAINEVLAAKDRIGPETAKADAEVKAGPPSPAEAAAPPAPSAEPHDLTRVTATGEEIPHEVAATPVLGAETVPPPEGGAPPENVSYDGVMKHGPMEIHLYTERDPNSPSYGATFAVDAKNISPEAIAAKREEVRANFAGTAKPTGSLGEKVATESGGNKVGTEGVPATLADAFTITGKEGKPVVIAGTELAAGPARDAWEEMGLIQKRGEGKLGYELTEKGRQIVDASISTEKFQPAHKALGVTEQEMHEGIPIQEVARRLSTDERATPAERAFAAIIMKFKTDAKLGSHGGLVDSDGSPSNGWFSPDHNAAVIEPMQSAVSARRVFLEEGLHSIDYWVQTNPETPQAKTYAAEMRRIHALAAAHPDAKNFTYALQLVDGQPLEMVPNMASNPAFFDFMNRALDSQGKSLFSKIVNAMAKFFGLKQGSLAHSALEQLAGLRPKDITITTPTNATPDLARREVQAGGRQIGAEPPEEHAEGREIMKGIQSQMAPDDPQRLVARGAEMVLEQGETTYGAWKAAMQKEFGGEFVGPAKVWRAVQNMLQSYNEAKTGKPLRAKSQIAQATGLQDSAAIMKENMANAVSRADALAAHLSGLEKGAEAGRKATEKTLRVADRWMAGDQERVRQDLVEFVNKTLPPDERGRYIGAITRALRRPDLLRGDPATMYRSAFRVMRTIDARAETVYKAARIQDIKDAFKRYADSPSVDVAYRDKIKALLDDVSLTKPSQKTLSDLQSMKEYVDRKVAAGEDPGIPKEALDKLDLLTKLPLKDMPTNAVDQLHEDIQRLAKLGKLKADLLEKQWADERQAMMDEMQTAEGAAVTARRAKRAQPGEELTSKEVAVNMKNAAANAVTQAELVISPTDMIGDLLDGSSGKYNGWWSRNVKGKLDLAHNAKEAALARIKQESRAIATQYKLTRQNFERIGVKGILNMIGRDRLEAMGIEKRVLDKIEKEPLSEGEQAYYDYTRKVYDDLGLKVKDLAHRLYQMDVTLVDHYVPLMRDWAAHAEREPLEPGKDPLQSEVPFDETATLRQLQEDTNYQRRTEQGFLKERIEGAKTSVKYNAQEVFERHVNDALHFLNAQPVLKMLGSIVATPEFKAKYGDIGQKITHDLLDTVATQGQVNGSHRLRWLDWVRNSTSKGAIAFRLASNLVHMSQVPLAAYHAGGAGWWAKGLRLLLSEEGQEFLKNNAAETYVRSGGEPAQEEAGIRGRFAGAAKLGFAIARRIDQMNAQATFLGRYAKEVVAKGADIDNVLGHPLDTDAQALALRRMRRAVASPLSKDVPQLISRGKGVGGNVSVARSLTQFKNIFLDIWSNVRHDFLRVGTGEMQDVWNAMRRGEIANGVKTLTDSAVHRSAVAAALLMGVALETATKFYVKKGIHGAVQAVTGAPPVPSKKDNETDAQQLQEAFVHHVVNRVPLVGNIMSAYDYSETGVPVVDAIVKPVIEAGKLGAARTPKTKVAHAVRGIGGAATVAGLPGISQAAEIAEPIVTKNLRGGRSGGMGSGMGTGLGP